MKKVLSLLLSSMLILSLCGAAMAESTAPVELTVACNDAYYAAVSFNDDLACWKLIEEKLNIKINWQVTADQYSTVMQTRLAAATDLPDVLVLPGSNPTLYGQQGLVIPLNDLIEQYGENIKKRFEEFPLAGKYMHSADGNIYGLAPIVQDNSREGLMTFMIRQDWLEKLDLAVPQTHEDVYNVLKAFKDKDANGNGEADEVGFVGNPFAAFGTGFGLYFNFNEDNASGFYVDENGQIYYQWTRPEVKDLLVFIKKLYDEGLLQPDYGSNESNASTAAETLISNNRVGSAFNWQDFIIQYGNYAKSAGADGLKYMLTEPIEGPAGRHVEEYGVLATAYTAISKDCKNPEVAIKLLDFMYSVEGQWLMAAGIEGVTYNIVDGEIIFSDAVLNDPNGVAPVNVLRTYGSWPTMCWVQLGKVSQAFFPDKELVAQWRTKLDPYCVMPLQKMLGTPEQEQEFATIMTDIAAYKDEMMVKFVRGEVSLDEFDTFVSTVDSMGVEDARAIMQSLYDATFSK